MDDFIEEIKEDVRRDQLLNIWRQYGNYIVGFIIAILLVTVGYLFWKNRTDQRINHETTQFENALKVVESGDQQAAEKVLQELIASSAQGYKTLALLELAHLKSAKGENGENIYKTIRDDKGIPEVYRQLADYHRMVEKFENTSVQAFLEELDPLLKQNSPWAASLIELKALALLKAGQTQAAKALFEQLLQSQDTPQALKLRAHAMAEQLS